MRVPLHRLAGVAAAALFLATASTAQAQGKGHGKGHDKDRGDEHAQVRDDEHERDDRNNDPRYEHRGNYDPRYEHRGNYDPRYDHSYDRNGHGTPPGLAKKPGGMPPGQYKKLYSTGQGASVLRDVLGRHGYPVVRTSDAGNSEYVYYRDHDGAVRRAVVSSGGDRLRFSAIPRALLDEINARLY